MVTEIIATGNGWFSMCDGSSDTVAQTFRANVGHREIKSHQCYSRSCQSTASITCSNCMR